MKEYGKATTTTTTTNVIIVVTLTIVLIGSAFVTVIPILHLQQKANACVGNQCTMGPDQPCASHCAVPPVTWSGGGEEAPGESDTSGLHAIIPALKSSSHSDDASKK